MASTSYPDIGAIQYKAGGAAKTSYPDIGAVQSQPIQPTAITVSLKEVFNVA